MSKKIKKFINKGKKSGLTMNDMWRIREAATRAAKDAERESAERAFVYMLAIPLNVLITDYWPKSARKRVPKFINDVMSLFDSVDKGIVTNEDLLDLLEDYAGVKIEVEWAKLREERSVQNADDR